MKTHKTIAALLALTSLSACAVGPDYTPPAAPLATHYDRDAEDGIAEAGVQRPAFGARIEGDWWSALRSADLDRVIRQAVGGNFDLRIADARIEQASEALRAAGGALYPQVDLGAQLGRARSNLSPATSSFYAIGPVVSFDTDIFGGAKRAVERQGALVEVEKHRFDAAYLTLTGNVASQALLLASAREQIEAVRILVADDERTVELLRHARQHGAAAQPDIALAETQLVQDQTLMPPLAQQRDAARHALAVLAGRGPDDIAVPDFDLSGFALPSDLPVSLPSDLAHDRPDILEAEAELHAASAEIGVATADLYPHLTLSGSFSRVGMNPASLWSVAAGLAGPVFHGGALEANRRGAEDGYRLSLALYQRTIVTSLGQVADILQSIHHDSEEYSAQQRVLAAAEVSLRLNRDGLEVGETGVLQVLDAERAYQRALLGRIRADTARYLDTVQLLIALGGNSAGISDRMAP